MNWKSHFRRRVSDTQIHRNAPCENKPGFPEKVSGLTVGNVLWEFFEGAVISSDERSFFEVLSGCFQIQISNA